MGTVRASRVHSYMDRELGLERRHRDLRHRNSGPVLDLQGEQQSIASMLLGTVGTSFLFCVSAETSWDPAAQAKLMALEHYRTEGR